MNTLPAFPDLTPHMLTSFVSAYEHAPASALPEHRRRARSHSRGPGGAGTPHVYSARRRQEDVHPPAENTPGGSGSGSPVEGTEGETQRRGPGRMASQTGSTQATRRMLLGLRRAGTEQARESEDLSDQEEAVYHQELATRNFGAEFLLPIGRRQTQVEADYPASPTPSDAPEQEHRQEDQEVDLPSPLEFVDAPEPPLVDLDDELEDMDRSREESGEASGGMEE